MASAFGDGLFKGAVGGNWRVGGGREGDPVLHSCSRRNKYL